MIKVTQDELPDKITNGFGDVTDKCRHTKCPTNYIDWSNWSDKKIKTHEQLKCPHCGLYAVWKKRDGTNNRDITE